MRIKKLEITGFKSFVDRTVVSFEDDVVGIVGPNGCGKSNIVDAIRWCMGEQSAKHLRGKSMSDVIFAGSESRGPLGVAEVTLVFDNSDQVAASALPLEFRDYAEIAITRRLYRDGTSEYLVNKTQVRLKDITDLFLGTGVGTKAYSIVEQGKIGLIVSARPEDRRMLIEEAAGITKYKARRKQAEQKMDATRQNLLRVGDIVSEIERNLASLKRQAAKAERYVKYRNELEDLVLHEASHKLLEIIVLDRVEREGREVQGEAAQAAKAALDAREAQLEAWRQQALEREEQAETAQTAAFVADNEVRALEGNIDKQRSQLAHLDARRIAATAEQRDLEDNLRGLDTERQALEDQMAGSEEEEHRHAEIVSDEKEKLDELVQTQQAAEQTAGDLRRRASEAKSVVAAAQATLTGFTRRSEEMSARRAKLEDEEARITGEVEDLAGRRETLEALTAELSDTKASTSAAKQSLDDEQRAAREKAVGLDREVDQARVDLERHRSRLRALEEIHARHEGVGTGVRRLLEMKSQHPLGDCVVGLIADRFDAPAELSRAFASLLGERLQYVVTTDLAAGVELLQRLGDEKKGRATLVHQRPAFVAGRRGPLTGIDGARGWLIDSIVFAAEDEPLARTMFGDVALVEHAEAARAVLAAGAAPTALTIGGMVFRADGTGIVQTLSGGTEDAVAAGMVDQKREIRELHEKVAERADRTTELLEAQRDHRARLSELGAGLERARNEAHRAELDLLTADKDKKRAETELATASRRLVSLRTELAELVAGLERAATEQAEAERRAEEGSTTLEEVGGAAEVAEEHAAGWREQALRQQQVVTEKKIEHARVRERAAGLRSTIDRLTRSCDEIRQRAARLDREALECAVGAGVAAAKVVLAREALVGAVDDAFGKQEVFTGTKRALEEARHELGLREADLRQFRHALAEATEKLSAHEMALQKLTIEREHLLNGVRERFRGLELPTIVGDYHKRPLPDTSHKARQQELAELIDRMGPVNVDAVREHAEAETRYTYYFEQKSDLDKAIADLEKAIQQMNRESKRLFRETYDNVNARFKVLFPRMFRGGTAELRLTNPDDLLETGIEILAQPPGKKLGNIELMSGGEKALTAVSLIFAIFQHKPSPFCILDEVDAPLDEANVARYNEAIRSMTHHSQFILITHIKRTMQSVDVLYGVTMQEPGVSKLVSVRVNARAESDSAQQNRRTDAAAPAAAVA